MTGAAARNPVAAAARPPLGEARRKFGRTTNNVGASGRTLVLPEQTEKRKKGSLDPGSRLTQIVRPDKVMRTEEDVYYQAANLLLGADYLLIAAGAGFSADSGLPVYKVRKEESVMLIRWRCLFRCVRTLYSRG
jgi:hypothetical protein